MGLSLQATMDQGAGFHVRHRNLLESRMKTHAYPQHSRLVLVSLRLQVYSALGEEPTW
jgi:hypothetical protein